MAEARRDATAFHTRVAEELSPNRRNWVNGRLLTGDVVDDAVEWVGGSCLNVPAQTQVEGHARVNAEIILHEERRVPAIGVACDGRVLRDRAGNADQEVRQRVPGRAIVECEDAVVVEQRLLNVLVERNLSAQLERVVALVPTEDVAYGIEVGAGLRAADRVCQGEEAADGDLRQRRCALDRERRTQIG